MTHNDIYTKFMIEYDKANITSSYPSLTEYEIATILDKAYLAIIAQKLTGNNTRKASFESDTKAIEDISQIFGRIDFEKVRYPEVEWDYFAFEALNMPKSHPARDEWETFFMDVPENPKYGKMVLGKHPKYAGFPKRHYRCRYYEQRRRQQDVRLFR